MLTPAVDFPAGVCYNGHMTQARGKFIVFEGADGSGKSTQLKQLFKYLKAKGIPCVSTREPTDSPFGALLRSCLTGRLETNEHTVAALFAADRLDHILNTHNGILKLLDEGITVLSDRFYLSSLAYNGGMVESEWVYALNEPAMKAVRPDLTLFIDLSTEESFRRVARRGETERYETLEKQRLIRERYFSLIEKFRERDHIAVIESDENKDVTQMRIRAAVDQLFEGEIL